MDWLIKLTVEQWVEIRANNTDKLMKIGNNLLDHGYFEKTIIVLADFMDIYLFFRN